jgi:hypothetical protein
MMREITENEKAVRKLLYDLLVAMPFPIDRLPLALQERVIRFMREQELIRDYEKQ